MTQLITAKEVIELGLSGKKMDPIKIEPNIAVAEYQWVKELLGDEFYYELVTEKNGSGLSVDNKVLWQYVLGQYTALAVLFMSLDDIQYDLSSQGIMLNNTEFSQSDRNGMSNLIRPKREKLLALQGLVDDFLRRNSAKYPKYKGNGSCAASKTDVFAAFGLNVDEEKGAGCCEKPTATFFPEPVTVTRVWSYGASCPDGTTIRLTRVTKNGDVLMSGNSDYDTLAALLVFLQTLDESWNCDGDNVFIESSDEWKVQICCCS